MNKCNTGKETLNKKAATGRSVRLHELEVCILNNHFNNKVISEVIIAAVIIVIFFILKQQVHTSLSTIR